MNTIEWGIWNRSRKTKLKQKHWHVWMHSNNETTDETVSSKREGNSSRMFSSVPVVWVYFFCCCSTCSFWLEINTIDMSGKILACFKPDHRLWLINNFCFLRTNPTKNRNAILLFCAWVAPWTWVCSNIFCICEQKLVDEMQKKKRATKHKLKPKTRQQYCIRHECLRCVGLL